MTHRSELFRRAQTYARRYQLALGDQLGSGAHGTVFAVESQIKPGHAALLFALKAHAQEPDYQRERDVYLRLHDHGVSEICGCRVPQLLV
jgi:hypothetical protein